MIPRTQLELSTEFPEGHAFWVPRGDELGEEGFGCFRSTWLIRGVTVRETRDVMEAEAALVDLAAQVSTTSAEYDQVAAALETGELEELPRVVVESDAYARAERFIPGDDVLTLGGLELGVAGAVHALSTVKCLPAARCRGHESSYAWSDAPVIFVAANRHRASVLQELVRETNCGFNADPARDGLLVVQAESVVEVMLLASAILQHRDEFVEHRTARPRPSARDGARQQSFDV